MASDLARQLASLRNASSGSFAGNYGYVGERGRGGTPRGAYGILDSNWASWSVRAGIPGANSASTAAQDRVAAYMLQRYMQRYGSFELAAVAWYGGTKSADRVARRGGTINNAKIARFVSRVTQGFGTSDAASAPETNSYGGQQFAQTQQNDRAGWVFPVAGENEWSRGSYMPKHTKGDRTHYAVDIYAPAGTPVVAPVSGKVLSIGDNKGIGGNTIQFLGDDGITYYFAHLNSKPPYEKGQRVIAGRQIGATGTSGNVPGKAQTHFTMKRNGKPIDNRDFLAGAESTAGLYANLKYEEPVTGDPNANAVAAGYGQEQPFGSTLPEQMVDTVSTLVAGGQRLDPRKWIDPNKEILDLEGVDQTIEGEVI